MEVGRNNIKKILKEIKVLEIWRKVVLTLNLIVSLYIIWLANSLAHYLILIAFMLYGSFYVNDIEAQIKTKTNNFLNLVLEDMGLYRKENEHDV